MRSGGGGDYSMGVAGVTKVKVRCGWMDKRPANFTHLSASLTAANLPSVFFLQPPAYLLSFLHYDLSELGVSFGCCFTVALTPSLRGR